MRSSPKIETGGDRVSRFIGAGRAYLPDEDGHAAPQPDIEQQALGLLREHGLRAMDAWHLAVARLVLPELADEGEDMAFASRDEEQSAVAVLQGLLPL